MMDQSKIDELCINTIRMLAADAVEKAKSGHPGTPMGLAPLAYLLWTRFLRHNPLNPNWPNRDRFVLSAGHVSVLLYSLLHLTGYELALEDLKRFTWVLFATTTGACRFLRPMPLPERFVAPGSSLMV